MSLSEKCFQNVFTDTLLVMFHESENASTTPILSRHFRVVLHNRSKLPLFRLVIAFVWDFSNPVKVTEI